MWEFKCTNDEIALVEDFNQEDKQIIVHYKGKVHHRNVDIIGKTLLPIATKNEEKSPKTVQVGCRVMLQSEIGIEIFQLVGIESETTYHRMGGPYDSSYVRTISVGTHVKEGRIDGAISTISPLGEVLLNKTVGETVRVKLKDGTVEYLILGID